MIEKIKSKIDLFLNKESLRYPDDSFSDLDIIEKEYNNIINSNDNEIAKLKSFSELLKKIEKVRFRYGGEYDALKSIPEYSEIISKFDNNEDINTIKYSKIKDVTSIGEDLEYNENDSKDKIRYTIVLNSIKSTFEDKSIRNILSEEELYSLYIEYYKLSQDPYYIEKAEKNLNNIMKKVWENTLTDINRFNNGDNFNLLVHNFSSGQDFEESLYQMENMRDNRISCSYITDNHVGLYTDNMRRCGLIYPKDSTIIISGDRDLYTNEFSEGVQVKNREHSSSICSPQYLEKFGVNKVKDKGYEFDFNLEYNEVVLDSSKKPIGLYIIGYGEKDINVDYNKLKELASKYNLPLIEIDMTEYRTKKGLTPLDENGKKYIARHVIYSYYNVNLDGNNDMNLVDHCNRLVDQLYEEIAEVYLKLKREDNLSKDNIINEIKNMLVSMEK